MKKSIIIASIILLLVFAASFIAGCQKQAPYEYHQLETISCDYDRIGEIAEMGRVLPPRLSYDEECLRADLIADVAILKREYSFGSEGTKGYTIFSARILNCYKSKLDYKNGDTIYFIQIGNPQMTAPFNPLLAEGSRLLLTLNLCGRHLLDEKAEKDYPILFQDMDAGLHSRFQIFSYEGVDYVISYANDYTSGNQIGGEMAEFAVGSVESDAIFEALLKYDPTLESLSIRGAIIKYDSMINDLRERYVIQ
ncbi:MAG: hypothetical protein J1E60_03460 [Christensenellaceae bacterium]|nr:hypothetical protein [Christensenellaceae bacterium]